MSPDANPEIGENVIADEVALKRFALALADGIDSALAGWVERCVERVLVAYRGRVDASEREAAVRAGQEAHDAVVPRVRALLESDIDQQQTGPLAIVRAAVIYPTAVLVQAGVPEVVRDEFVVRQFPEDIYDLTPVSFSDIDVTLQELGLVWGAAKAHVHLSRRRLDGQR